MKIEKHELLSLTHQPLHMKQKLFMSFTAALAFDLTSGEPVDSGAAFAAAMGALDAGECLDLGVAKPEAEWLLAGSAFTPGGEPAKRTVVSSRVGGSERRLIVESREPFVSVPLSWKSTWGRDDENPDGPRAGDGEKPPVSDAALPYGAPACMGPRGAWPCRMKRMGTYDSKWLKENWPGVPDDFDWGFYNLSQPSQRLPKGINGGEKIILINMNEKIPRIETKAPKADVIFRFSAGGKTFEKRPKPDTLWLFPGELVGLMLWHAVAECDNEAGAGIDTAEARLEIDGVSPTPKPEPAAPPAAAAGSAPSAAAKTLNESAAGAAAAAVTATGAAAASESAKKSQTSGGAQSAEAPRKDDAAAKQSSEAADAMPTAAELRANAYAELEKSLPEINAALVDAGFQPLTPEQTAETKAHIDKLTEKFAELQAKAEATKPPTLEEALANAGASNEQIASVKKAIDIPVPSPSDFTDKAEWDKAVEKYASEFGAAFGGDEKTAKHLQNLLSSLPVGEQQPAAEENSLAMCTEQLVKAGMEPAAAARFVAALEEDVPTDPNELLNYATRLEKAAGFPEGSVRGNIEKIQNKMEELGVPLGSSQGASEQPAAQTAEEIAKPQAEKAAEEKITEQAASDPKNLPLTAENLPAILAAGGSLAGAKLDGFNLAGFNFSGLDLKGASFAGAKLNGARFDGATLAGVSFAGAALKNVSFSGADLSAADFTSASVGDADFSNAVMSGANFSGAALAGVSISRAKADGLSASGADFSGARISFSDLSGADFAGANLSRADLHEVNADGANFAKAEMSRSTLCWGSSARGCSFEEANLSEANWTNSNMGGSDFSRAAARGASFTDCDISSSRWDGADTAGGDFSRSSVEGASMRGINLFRGSLRETRASGADLSGGNLFGADLCRIFTDDATSMKCADVGQTIVEARKGK